MRCRTANVDWEGTNQDRYVGWQVHLDLFTVFGL